jgi:pimeloyl-ACP methyl ester carboxylesterase
MRRALSLVLPALAALALLAPAAASAATAPKCEAGTRFTCETLDVPVDRAGGVPGSITLHYAVQKSGAGRPLLLALAGGPGQGAVSLASSFALSLEPMLAKFRLVVLDQRGTGQSGSLDCPNLQALGSVDLVSPAQIASCAERIGPRRAFYGTADSVADIDALRERLGVEKLALFGISYGTFVAAQYARTFPDRVDRLVLDSVVAPDGIDPWLLDSYRPLDRLLHEQCASNRCRGITTDIVGDLAQMVKRLRRAPLRGKLPATDGVPREVTIAGPDELANLVTAGDLNPLLQPAVPAALRSAILGDPTPLLRLRRVANGPPTSPKELSFGVNVAAGCADVRLPYPLTAPPEERRALADEALAAIPPDAFGPLDRETVRSTSYAEDCIQWPEQSPPGPSAAPLPDVPALLFSGRLDFRTPVEGARALKDLMPHASLVTVPGTGHDELDSDITGCTIAALRRFAANQPVGDPCAKDTNQIPPFPRAPLRLRDFRRAPGIKGDRGRVLFAAIDTAIDARIAALQLLFAGFEDLKGGGLRGGRFTAKLDDKGADVNLYRYQYLAGVRVTGKVRLRGDGLSGHVRVDGPGRLDGALDIDRKGGAKGTLGGRRVRYTAGRVRAFMATPAGHAPASSFTVPWASLQRRMSHTLDGER